MSAWKYFEGEVARFFKSLGLNGRRLWEVQFKEGGGVDVRADGFDIQCKYSKDKMPDLRKAWFEANNSKIKGNIPMAVCRSSENRNTLVCLSFNDFKRLLINGIKRYHDNQ